MTPFKSFKFLGRLTIFVLLMFYGVRLIQRNPSMIKEYKVDQNVRMNYSRTLDLEKELDKMLKKRREE